MSNTKFETVSIKNSKGVFYLSSKTKEAGYDVEFEKDGETYYHKEFDTLTGKLSAMKLRENKYGKQISMFFEKEDNTVYVLNVNVFNKGSRMDDWAKAFTLYLENLKIGEQTEIELNRKRKDKKDYLFKNAFVQQNGQKVNWGFSPIKDVPKWEKTTDKVTGGVAWDSSDQDKFYYDKIRAVVKEEDAQQNGQPEQKSAPIKKEEPQTEAKVVNKTKGVEVKIESDGQELPF